MQALAARSNTAAFRGVSRRPAMRICAVQDLQGTVVSTNPRTAVVAVERLATHKEYMKRVRITKKYIAHDEASSCKVGDYVRLEGCRPLSKNKRFKVAEVLREAK